MSRSLEKLKPLYLTTTVPMATKLGKMMTNLERLLPMLIYTWSSETRNRLKPLYLRYHSGYGHQTWQDGD